MGAVLKVNRHDSVVTVGLRWYTITWERGRLLWGGPVFGSSDLSSFQLDLRYWEVVPGEDINFEGTPRAERDVLLIVKEGERAFSRKAIGYEKIMKEKQDAYAVFLKDGGNELVSSRKYNIYFQTVHDPAKGQTFEVMLAIRKAS